MRFLITQSLLSSWLYQWSDFSKYNEKAEEYQAKAEEDFLRTLRREEIPASEDMQNGIAFEQLVTDILQSKDMSRNEAFMNWGGAAACIVDIIKGGQLQLVVSRKEETAGISFILYGRLDCLKAGTIYDIKFSKKYEVGKYFDIIQHSMYFSLVPEARKFVYLISNGNRVWQEAYTPEETPCIDEKISEFISYLRERELLELYFDKWKSLL